MSEEVHRMGEAPLGSHLVNLPTTWSRSPRSLSRNPMQGSHRATRMPQQSVPRLEQAPISLTCLGFLLGLSS